MVGRPTGVGNVVTGFAKVAQFQLRSKFCFGNINDISLLCQLDFSFEQESSFEEESHYHGQWYDAEPASKEN